MTYSKQFPRAEDSILLEEDGTPVGRLLVEHHADYWRILDIEVLTAHRGKGMGTRALQQCQTQCKAVGARLELQVRRANPARQLYERLGFLAISEDDIAVKMAWNAEA